MSIKHYITIFLSVSVTCAFAQALKPMSDSEFKYYESQIRAGQTERYKKPYMPEETWKKLLNDIISQVVEAKVPSTIQGWKKKGAANVPSRDKIALLAHRLRKLVEDPELEEVSRQKLQWFKNIGNEFIKLENDQIKMYRAVVSGREKEYRALYYQYTLNIKKLEKLLNGRDDWKLSRKELDVIQKKNIAARKKNADELKRRYEYTRKLRRDSEAKEKRENKGKKNNTRNTGTTRKGARR